MMRANCVIVFEADSACLRMRGLLNKSDRTFHRRSIYLSNQAVQEDKLGKVMRSPVITMDEDGTLGTAAKLMIQHDIGAVVVARGTNPIGIVTERDITKQVVKADNALKKPIRELMTNQLITATEEMLVQQAFELMLKNKIRRLPIVEGGKLKGIVTTQDIMRWVLRVSYEPNVPKNIKEILDNY